MTVLIDLHGAPGSQNGQDHSGLIGPILFPANTTNTERSLGVLKNLTEEFSKTEYGGVVTCEYPTMRPVQVRRPILIENLRLRGNASAIELLNEPRIGQADFEMDDLKAFYTAGSEAVRTTDQGMGVMVHGASCRFPHDATESLLD